MRIPSCQGSSLQITKYNTQSILHVFQFHEFLQPTGNLPNFSIPNIYLLIIKLLTRRIRLTKHYSSHSDVQFTNIRDILILSWFLRLVLFGLRGVLLLLLFLLLIFFMEFFLFFFLTLTWLTPFLLLFFLC